MYVIGYLWFLQYVFYESSAYLSLIPMSTEGTIFWLVFWKMVLVNWDQVLHSGALVSFST